MLYEVITHAGTVNLFGKGGAAEKIGALEAAGVGIVPRASDIGETVRAAMAR